MNMEIEKYILKRLIDKTPVQYNSFRSSKENIVKKWSREEFNEKLKELKQRNLIQYSADTSLVFSGEPKNIQITKAGEEYYKTL